jgi:transposase
MTRSASARWRHTKPGTGGSHEVASLFQIGYRTVERWVAGKRATGSVAADPKRGGWHSPIEMPTLLAVVGDAPDSTLAELCWEYNRRVTRGQRSTVTSIGRALHREGFVLKKTAATERVRPAGRCSEARGVPEMDASSRPAPADFHR